MTSVFSPDGRQTACTIIEAGPCVVTQKKTVDTDGYDALQIAFGEAKEKNTPKALLNHFAKANTSPKAVVKELRNCSIDKQVGEALTCDIFAEGEKVSVIGTSKGKGFQGVVKRHGFHGGPNTHGNTKHRRPGSIGPGTDPSRVIKGKKMPGHYGDHRHTQTHLRIEKIDAERNLIYIRGSVAGPTNGIVLVKKQG